MNMVKKIDSWIIKGHERTDLEWKLAREDVIAGTRNYVLGAIVLFGLMMLIGSLGVKDVAYVAIFIVGIVLWIGLFVMSMVRIDRKVKEFKRMQHDEH